MLGLKLSPKAHSDLDAIWLYTVRTWGTAQAKDYLIALGGTIDILRVNPELGVSIEDIRPGYRRMTSGSHSIIYRIGVTDVEIIRFLHKSMDVEGKL